MCLAPWSMLHHCGAGQEISARREDRANLLVPTFLDLTQSQRKRPVLRSESVHESVLAAIYRSATSLPYYERDICESQIVDLVPDRSHHWLHWHLLGGDIVRWNYGQLYKQPSPPKQLLQVTSHGRDTPSDRTKLLDVQMSHVRRLPNYGSRYSSSLLSMSSLSHICFASCNCSE